jgi:hypothetical protein
METSIYFHVLSQMFTGCLSCSRFLKFMSVCVIMHPVLGYLRNGRFKVTRFVASNVANSMELLVGRSCQGSPKVAAQDFGDGKIICSKN